MLIYFANKFSFFKLFLLLSLLYGSPLMAMGGKTSLPGAVSIDPEDRVATSPSKRADVRPFREERLAALENRLKKAFPNDQTTPNYEHTSRTNLIALLKAKNREAVPDQFLGATVENIGVILHPKNRGVFKTLWENFFRDNQVFLTSTNNTWSLQKVNEALQAVITKHIPTSRSSCSSCCEEGGCCAGGCWDWLVSCLTCSLPCCK